MTGISVAGRAVLAAGRSGIDRREAAALAGRRVSGAALRVPKAVPEVMRQPASELTTTTMTLVVVTHEMASHGPLRAGSYSWPTARSSKRPRPMDSATPRAATGPRNSSRKVLHH